MILLEVVDAEHRKKSAANSDTFADVSTRRHSEVLLAHSGPPLSSRLPDYATSQAHAEQQTILKETPNQRTWTLRRAVVCALLIYLVLSVAVALPLYLVLRRSPFFFTPSASEGWVRMGPQPPPLQDRLPPDIANLPSTYGQAIRCNNWTQSTSPYSLQYSVPANETIYLRSNFSEVGDSLSSPVTGSLLVSITNDTSQSDAVISVDMRDIRDGAVKLANVCLMRTDDGWGLAIYALDDSHEDDYQIDIVLSLPQPKRPSQLFGLATYLPSFNQTFEQLDAYSGMDSFTVQGSVGNIDVESVRANSVLVTTSAAAITGSFNGSEKVILETVLSPIVANISLYNTGGKGAPPTLLNVETGNSNITVNITLYTPPNASVIAITSSTSSKSTGKSDGDDDDCPHPATFLTSISTFGGALSAVYRHHPTAQPSVLFVKAQNNLAPSEVFVDAKFVGTYDVHTTLADAIVDRTAVADPTGAGRTRTYVDDYVSANRAYGWAGWGLRPAANSKARPQQGQVEVVSSLSAAVLQMTDQPDPSRFASQIWKTVYSQKPG